MKGNTMKTVFTTAPQDYDGFSTETADENAGRDKSSGKIYRQVEMQDRDYNWQSSRYGSGMHCSMSQDQFNELVDAGLVITASKEERLQSIADATVEMFHSVEQVNHGMWQVPHAEMQKLMKAVQSAGIEF